MPPRVFISYALEDEVLAGQVVSALTGIGIESFLGSKDIGWGEDIEATIRKGLASCMALIVILSEASKGSEWVPFEVGQAKAQDKLVLPLLKEENALVPGFLSGVRHARSVADVVDYFQSPPPQGQRLTPRENRDTPVLPGNVVVPGYFHLGTTEQDLENAMSTAIQQHGRLPEAALYWDPRSAQTWIKYEEPSRRRSFISSEVLAPLRGKKLDVLSLGPGSGKKDINILLNVTCQWYYAVDVSYTLLEFCAENASRSLPKDIYIRPIHADFFDLPSLRDVYQYETNTNLFLLLGNTLGNYVEPALLGAIKRAMLPGDFLLLEVEKLTRTLQPIQENEIVREKKFDDPYYRNFILSPLTNRVNLTNGQLRFRGNRRLTDVPDSVAVEARYEWPGQDPITITHSTYYEPARLVSYMQSSGFELRSRDDNQHYFVALFRKA
jgi:hypothetical protein